MNNDNAYIPHTPFKLIALMMGGGGERGKDLGFNTHPPNTAYWPLTSTSMALTVVRLKTEMSWRNVDSPPSIPIHTHKGGL